MNVIYDKQSDVLYITFRDEPAAWARERDGIVIRYGTDGEAIGITFISWSMFLVEHPILLEGSGASHTCSVECVKMMDGEAVGTCGHPIVGEARTLILKGETCDCRPCIDVVVYCDTCRAAVMANGEAFANMEQAEVWLYNMSDGQDYEAEE